MKKKNTYFKLVDLKYEYADLTVRVVELVEGEPDGCVGVPLVVSEESRYFTINFNGVTEFRSKAEACFLFEGDRVILSEFLFEFFETEYVSHVCPFGEGAKDPARHFCVFTEFVVVEVLSSNEPRIEMTGRPE